MGNLPPIKTKAFRKYLKKSGLEYSRIKGDHEIWTKAGLFQPITFPRKSKEIYGIVISSNCKTLGIDTQTLYDFVRGVN